MSNSDLTDHITDNEALKILSRFNASHWDNPSEHARYSIPADPKRDDDIRLGAYIEQTRKLRDWAKRAATVMADVVAEDGALSDGDYDRLAELVREWERNP